MKEREHSHSEIAKANHAEQVGSMLIGRSECFFF